MGLLFPRDSYKSFNMRMNKQVGGQVPSTFAAFCKAEAACVNMAVVGAGQPNYVTAVQCNAANQAKREYTMIDQEVDQRRYILDRTRTVQCQKSRDLEETFGLVDDVRPTNPEDLIKRIQDGKFVLTARDEFDDDEDCGYYHNFERLHWRDPAKVRDQEGNKAAQKRLLDASQKLSDKARLYTIADATKAFEEFEATDFTNVH